jgi:hypothetical protein
VSHPFAANASNWARVDSYSATCALSVNSSTSSDGPYLRKTACRILVSAAFFGFEPAWKNHASLKGQSLSAGMNFFRLASGGMFSLSPCSAVDTLVGAYRPVNH